MPDFVFDSSLVLYLPLYQLDGESFMSRDTYGHLVLVSGGTLWTPQGRYFDGVDDKISCGNNSVLESANNLTIVLWVKPGAQVNAYAAIISKQDDTGDPYKGYLIDRNDTSNTQYRFVYGTGSAYRVATNFIVTTTGVWQQIAVTKSGTTVTMFVNSVQTSTETMASATIGTNTDNLQLGDWPDSGAGRRYWVGDIGEVYVYNRALSPLEVQNNYLKTKWRYQ